ncbi:MAG: hypothetical protein ABIH17_09910 [Pseudomonadota bacterium]
MKRLWPGWLLCLVTAGLIAYVTLIEVPAISALLGGLKLPDQVPLGYDEAGARALYAAFAADLAAAQEHGRQSAAAAYQALHAGSDLIFPPLLTASLGFCAFAALYARGKHAETPLLVRVGLGLVLALAFAYLGCDFVENAVADAMFGPNALRVAFNEQFVFVLRVLTISKFTSVAIAFGLIAALWISCWRSKREQPVAGD